MNKLSSSKISETDWERIDAMEDKDIDLSDIPEVTEAQMVGAVLRVGGQPVERGKQQVTMLLDKFVVEYFKIRMETTGAEETETLPEASPEYQALINAALVEYIQNHNLKEDLRHIVREELSRMKDAS